MDAGEEREQRFEALCREAAGCRRCPAMAGRRRVLSDANGRPGALVCFVGEAPGRRGGERTGVPFSGDQSGRNFTALLAVAGLARAEVFITNAVLCNPRDERDRNRAPSRAELTACRDFLARQLALVDPPIVAPLGAVALAALDALAPHGQRLRTAAGHAYAWHGRVLAPLYHPSPRAQLHRPFARQADDFARLGRLARLVQAGTPPILSGFGNLSAALDVARLDAAAG
ncbi:MAG TPA: uracil-DNA glycosylase [Thermomicrobiales bacterium]|nr:uracil-DNA glycosylase [Thermomicrobiales bacterium]